MDYRIEKKKPFQIICKRKRVTVPQGDTATADISAFWNECSQDGTIQALCSYMLPDPALKGVLGVCFSGDMEHSGFPYGIGVEYNGAPVREAEFEVFELPACNYAVFQCRGKMPEAFQKTYRQICTEFFPQSGYEYGCGMELEVYPSANVRDPNYTCEIWVAVKEKN